MNVFDKYKEKHLQRELSPKEDQENRVGVEINLIFGTVTFPADFKWKCQFFCWSYNKLEHITEEIKMQLNCKLAICHLNSHLIILEKQFISEYLKYKNTHTTTRIEK